MDGATAKASSLGRGPVPALSFQPLDSWEAGMKPRLSIVTLGVDDLERSLRFYRDGLGLQTPGIIGAEFEHGAVAFLDLQPGLKLAIWPRAMAAPRRYPRTARPFPSPCFSHSPSP